MSRGYSDLSSSMTRAHSEVLGLSFPRLRPSLFLAAHSPPSDGDSPPEASQVRSVVLSSLVLPLYPLVGVLFSFPGARFHTRAGVPCLPTFAKRSCRSGILSLRATKVRLFPILNVLLFPLVQALDDSGVVSPGRTAISVPHPYPCQYLCLVDAILF